MIDVQPALALIGSENLRVPPLSTPSAIFLSMSKNGEIDTAAYDREHHVAWDTERGSLRGPRKTG